MNTTPKNIFIGLVSIFVVVALFVYLKYAAIKNEDYKRERVFANAAKGKVALGKGNYDEAIESYKSALDLSDSKEVRAILKLNAGIASLETMREEAREKAIAIFKEVAADEEAPKEIQARALSLIIKQFSATHDTEFAKKYIFTDEPYASFLVNNDYELAERKFNEYSLTIFPTAKAEFRIALWYGKGLLYDKKDPRLDSQTRQTFLDNLQKHYQSGSTLFDQEHSPRGGSHYINTIGQKALVLKYLALLGKGDPSEVDKLYQRAMATAELYTDDVNIKKLVFSLRFHRAAALYALYGITASADIKKTLAPFTPEGIKNTYFYKFLAAENDPVHELHHHHGDIINLAAISPEFKKTAESTGWKFK